MDIPVLQSVDRTSVLWNGSKYLFFGGYDYHRHSIHPEVIAAFQRASIDYGINSGGSLWTTGTHPLHRKLESSICNFISVEAVALLPSCYLANRSLIQYFLQNVYDIYYPEVSHPSLKPPVNTVCYSYSDLNILDINLKKSHKPLIIAESIINNGNSIAPIDQLIQQHSNVVCIIDDAHGIGVIGKTGRGILEEAKVHHLNNLVTGSLSKGIGVFGGFIGGSKKWINKIKQLSSVYQGSSSLPLPVCAAAIKSIQILKTNTKKIKNLRKNSISFKENLLSGGIDIVISPTPVIAIKFENENLIKDLKDNMLKNGIFPSIISYPGNLKGNLLRIAISSLHTQEDLNNLSSVLLSSL
ncbi:MAG: hypothetical protein CMG69_05765 [Candidatus Marinimicrobia bacterium]|nr:hypothetical protein [Candidatus Neomarinimicrobiota bacterium]|tara:strand:- start:76328 stop:77392 length:1065 start_codon:yes stop_codon:yes gene_type:complete